MKTVQAIYVTLPDELSFHSVSNVYSIVFGCMKRVFILCDLYPPAFGPRVAYLTQYIGQYGWSPVVFTEDVNAHQLFSDFRAPCPVYRITPYGGRVRGGGLSVLELVLEAKDRYMADEVERLVSQERLGLPDVILCLSYRKFPLYAASQLAVRWRVPWVADCRDIVEQYSRGDFLPAPLEVFGYRLTALEKWIGVRYINQRNKALRSASVLSTVSKWHSEVLSRVHPRVEVIYNGYDEKLFRAQLPQKTKRFRIVFTGRLLSLDMRNPSLLLEVLRLPELSRLPIDLLFYTDEYSAQLLGHLGTLGGNIRFTVRPMVPSRQVPEILASASLLLLLGNEETEHGPHGMISTKLFEAMAMQRPIVLLPDATSETAELVRQSGLGIATNDAEELRTYLLRLVAEWKSNGYTSVSYYNEGFISEFTRQRQAGQFARLLNEALSCFS